MTQKKYTLSAHPSHYRDGIRIYRIRALRSFGDVEEGDWGGFVESESNLSHFGNCWIYDDAIAMGNSIVTGDAKMMDSSVIKGSSVIMDEVKLSGAVVLPGNSIIRGNTVMFSTPLEAGGRTGRELFKSFNEKYGKYSSIQDLLDAEETLVDKKFSSAKTGVPSEREDGLKSLKFALKGPGVNSKEFGKFVTNIGTKPDPLPDDDNIADALEEIEKMELCKGGRLSAEELGEIVSHRKSVKKLLTELITIKNEIQDPDEDTSKFILKFKFDVVKNGETYENQQYYFPMVMNKHRMNVISSALKDISSPKAPYSSWQTPLTRFLRNKIAGIYDTGSHIIVKPESVSYYFIDISSVPVSDLYMIEWKLTCRSYVGVKKQEITSVLYNRALVIANGFNTIDVQAEPINAMGLLTARYPDIILDKVVYAGMEECKNFGIGKCENLDGFGTTEPQSFVSDFEAIPFVQWLEYARECEENAPF